MPISYHLPENDCIELLVASRTRVSNVLDFTYLLFYLFLLHVKVVNDDADKQVQSEELIPPVIL